MRNSLSALLDELEQARALLECYVDDEPCDFDHHGGCQAHGFLSLEPGELCPNEAAKRLLDREGNGDG